MRSRSVLIAIFLATLAPDAFGQGCAMCLASASAQGAPAALALNRGVLVLLIPPFLMILGVLAFTFLRRSQ
jgi:hypothetical protein